MQLKITEINGWSKTIDIKKAITRIGNSPNADIQLPSNTIAPIHIQLLTGPELPTGCRVVNLANQLEVRGSDGKYSLVPYSTGNLSDGDEIQLGEYLLTFTLPLSTGILRTSTSIEASLNFVDTLLQPDLVLDGCLVIKNVGGKDACQFQVMLSGFPEDCYRIDPIPLLYPGAQEEVRLRLFHRTTYPPAGFHELMLVVSAPDSYPGEELVIRQGIYVAPVFKQSIEIDDDLASQPIIEFKPKPRPLAQVISEPEPKEEVLEEKDQIQPPSLWESKPREIEQVTLQTEKQLHAPQTQIDDGFLHKDQVSAQVVEMKAVNPAQSDMTILEHEEVTIPVEIPDVKAPEWSEEQAVQPTIVQPPIRIQSEEIKEPYVEEKVESIAQSVLVNEQQAQDEFKLPEPIIEEAKPIELPLEEPSKETGQPEQTIQEPIPGLSPTIKIPETSTKSLKPLTFQANAPEEIWEEMPPEKTTPIIAQDTNLSKVKVVRTQKENYWDEK